MEILLELPNIQVQDAFEDREGSYIVTLISTQQRTKCRKCGKWIEKTNGNGEWITVRHLDILGKPVHLRLRFPRYRCDCDGSVTTTQQVDWLARRSRFTKAYEQHLLLSCVNATVADVARKDGLGDDAVLGVIERNLRSDIDWSTVAYLHAIGTDEVSLRKGHRDFVVIITGRSADQTHMLGVLKDRSKATVKAFFSSIPKRLRKTVRFLCTDLYDGFINATKEVFGRRIRIVADRFHVAKLYREGVEDLRKKELRRLKRTLPAATYKRFKGAMWALRKREGDLTAEERDVIDLLFQHSPRLQQVVLFRDELTAIFDQTLTPKQAKLMLNGWAARVKRSPVRCFDRFINTLMLRKEEISNYFVERLNSGFVEGLNNKIKVIKRRCYGITNTEHLFQRICLDLFGYQFFSRPINGLRF
jgi:transposase